MAIDPDTHRNTLLREQDERIARDLAESMRSGELQSAASFGRPLAQTDGWDETPVEFRMAFKVLKNAGMPPPELAVFKTRAELRAQLEAAVDNGEKQVLRQQLADLEQALALRLEGMRASGTL
ncbi:MAG: DUF1992 domain-containing protein [Proteobacteria bacterium]|nr:DUF1992 domain-containing protein [Burkholderiaceae bacterium]MCH8854997.1 DUF1992 domain-containing protein [Pseudomonadota bacterium]